MSFKGQIDMTFLVKDSVAIFLQKLSESQWKVTLNKNNRRKLFGKVFHGVVNTSTAVPSVCREVDQVSAEN